MNKIIIVVCLLLLISGVTLFFNYYQKEDKIFIPSDSSISLVFVKPDGSYIGSSLLKDGRKVNFGKDN